MQIVAGLSLKNLQPRVWDRNSIYHLANLQAVMISYADFDKMPTRRQQAMEQGLHTSLSIPPSVRIYLDNGAFYFLARDGEMLAAAYEEFVEQAKPDWRPVPQDFIPLPNMSLDQQRECLTQTMRVNQEYQHDGFVPVIHVSRVLGEYITAIKANEQLSAKPAIALGGIVPNLLRTPKAISYQDLLDHLRLIRKEFADKKIHIFGIGGTATLHIAALLGIDSVDSSGWRNRAARGIVQLQGSGDRVAAELGSWRGRRPSEEEWRKLGACPCPACKSYGLDGLKAKGTEGFSNRATHNLWILLEEARLIQEHLDADTYQDWYKEHLDNSTYLPVIEKLVGLLP
jgi:hypothetical protein